MSKICMITGKKRMVGNNVSHANNRTKRRFDINIQTRRFYDEETKKWVALKVSSKGLRIINKLGLKAVLKKLRDQGEKV